MKYRVKKITRADGKEEFFPQHKHLLFWSDCYEMGTFRVKCNTFQKAEEYIIMWEGWKLAKKQYNKPLNHTTTARVVKDLNIDGYSLEAYGISVGDRVYIRDWDELSKTFEVSKDGVEWIVAELEELEFS